MINRLTATPIITINNINDLNRYPDSTVIFLLSLPSSSSSSTATVKANFEAVAKKHYATCYFAMITTSSNSSPVISKIETGNSNSNSNKILSNSGSASIDDIEAFVHHHNHQLITNLENHNFKTLGSKNKTMVISIINSSEKPNGLSQQGTIIIIIS